MNRNLELIYLNPEQFSQKVFNKDYSKRIYALGGIC
jgi:hypothetical protein